MKKLLLVDDDIALRKQFCFALENRYEIFEADNKEEAFEIIEKTNLDIALVDLGLPPHENSYQEGKLVVTKLLQTCKAKIIVLTGQEKSEYAQDLIQMGVFDYLLKPLAMPLLLASLTRASFFIDNEAESKSVKLSFFADFEDGLKGSSDEAQKQLLLAVLKKTNFNINQSAKILGISRENCYYFLKKFNIERPDA
jgi:DNA-binding NtrC family response regulator